MRKFLCTMVCAICLLNFKALAAEPEFEVLLAPIPPLVMKTDIRDKGFLWDIANALTVRMQNSGNFAVKSLPKILPWKRAVHQLSKQPNQIMLQMARSPKLRG